MKDWHLSTRSYYTDFVVAPVLALAAVTTEAVRHGPSARLAAGVALGVLGWTAVEYVVHRWIFHVAYRREHMAHHQRPKMLIGVPPWQTALAFAAVFGAAVGATGWAWGSGLFAGMLAGYFGYIAIHERMHHGSLGRAFPGNCLDRQARRHAAHHHGTEGNFGVTTPLWDFLLGTLKRA